MNEIEKELAEYAKEIGVDGLSIESLIGSHRRLRAENMKSLEQRQNENDEIMKKVFDFALANNYVSFDRLKQMTVLELAEFVGINE